jgi:hypothetical protein
MEPLSSSNEGPVDGGSLAAWAAFSSIVPSSAKRSELLISSIDASFARSGGTLP